MKLNPIRDNIAGKRLVVVEDSIVRGTTMRALVSMLREAGAAEVHLRISSPPYRWPCYFGMDTGIRAELLAADLTVPEVRDYLGCDTLAYLEIDALLTATGSPRSGFCAACLTGDYPVKVLGMADASDEESRTSCPTWTSSTPVAEAPAWVRPTPPRASTSPPARRRSSGSGPRCAPPSGPRCSARSAASAGCSGSTPPATSSPVLVSSTDSVGTKALVARRAGRLDTIGIDLVAMVVDDIAVQGAEPLFFLDCVTVGQLDPDDMETAGGRRGRGLPPGRLRPDRRARWPRSRACSSPAPSTWSASGSASSSATASSPAPPSHPATASSGCRLPACAATATRWPAGSCSTAAASRWTARRGPAPPTPSADELLRPSVIYSPALVELCRTVDVHAMAHITGGGLPGNLPRVLPPDCDAGRRPLDVGGPGDLQPRSSELGDVGADEMAKVFNLGIGMVAIVAPADVDQAHDHPAGRRPRLGRHRRDRPRRPPGPLHLAMQAYSSIRDLAAARMASAPMVRALSSTTS